MAIARTLIHNPEVILFDEPTTGLDITSANIFRQLIHQLKGESKTILFSSHIMEEVQLLCQSVIMIHKGRLIYHGSLQQLYKNGEGLGGAIKPTPVGVGYMNPSQQTFVPYSFPMVT